LGKKKTFWKKDTKGEENFARQIVKKEVDLKWKKKLSNESCSTTLKTL